MGEQDWLAERFEANRTHLRAVAYRMLGSPSEADDAVQESWLRFSRSDVGDVENLGGWLTTVVARVCLDMLRSRGSRREEPLGPAVHGPIAGRRDGSDPEHEPLLADSVGLAMLVVLETPRPAERVAFVLHDMFDLPFDEIAPIVGRSPTATRKLASRARRPRAPRAAGPGDPRRMMRRPESRRAAQPKEGSVYTLHPIGRVSSPLVDRDHAPKQGDEGAPAAWLVFEPEFEAGLRDLRVGEEILVLTWLDRGDRETLRVHPRDDPNAPLRGVFCTRSQDRPNPVGIHRVTIVEIASPTRLKVLDVEAFDGTPIIDVKPVLDRVTKDRDP